MKSAPAALIAYLNGLRPTSDAPLLTAECFTIWLSTGTILTYTDLDTPVSLNGFTYLANSVLISGLKYKASCGVNVDSQQVMIFARPTDTIGGIPFLQAVQQGVLDGAAIQREKVFFSDWSTPIGSVILFKGRVAQIDSIGRVSAQVTVASDMVLLDIDMPRNVYQADCQHVLYDAQCGLAAGTYSTAGAVGAGSTQTAIMWSAAVAGIPAGNHRLHLRRQHGRQPDDQVRRRRPPGPVLSAALSACGRRRLRRHLRLRPHHGHLQGPFQQSLQVSRLSLRAAAADRDGTAVVGHHRQRQGRQVGGGHDRNAGTPERRR